MLSFIVGDSELAQRIRAHPWQDTELGPPEDWSDSLKTLVSVMLAANQQMYTVWGPGRILLYNDRYIEVLQGHHPNALGRDFLEVWSEIADDLRPLVERAYASIPTYQDDITLMLQRGGRTVETHFAYSYTPIINAGGDVDGFFCPCIETTEQVNTENLHRESEARFRAIAEQTEAGVAVADREGRLIWVNDRLAEIVGRQPNDTTRLLIQDCTHPDDWGENERLFDRMIDDGVPFVFEKRLGHPDGGTRWNRVSVSPRRDAGGRVVGGIAVTIDISDRRRADETLRASEERMRLAIAATGLGTFDWDLATDRVVVNARFCEIVGLPAGGEVIASAMMDGVVHPDDRDWVGARIAAAMDPSSSGAYEFEHRAATSNGVRWLLTSGQVHFADEGDRRRAVRIVGNDLDITERKKGEIALRESEERQAYLLQLNDALRSLADVEAIQKEAMRLLGEKLGVSRAQYYTADETGEFLSSSGGYTDGVPAAIGRFHLIEFGKYAYDGFHAGETQVVSDARTDPRISETILKSYETVGFLAYIGVPFVHRGKFLGTIAVHQAGPREWTDSERILVEETAERAGIAVEQARAEAALRESEERLRQFGEASQDVLWIRDAETLRWTYLTPAFEEIYGLSREEALGAHDFNTWIELILPEDRETAVSAIGRVRAGDRAAFEYRIRRPIDGEMRWLRNTDFPITDETGRVTMIGGVGHDITPLKKAEEHQALLLAELQHRVRNTLGVIRNIVRQTAERSETIEDNTAHLEGRINAFARVQAAVTRNPTAGIGLASMVADELRVAGAREGESLTIEGSTLMLAPKAAEVIGLAIHELATNAVKYGALTTASGKIVVRWQINDDKLAFEWKEHGMGNLGLPTRKGFGSEILEQTLPYMLKADVTLAVEPTGLRFRAELPMVSLIR